MSRPLSQTRSRSAIARYSYPAISISGCRVSEVPKPPTNPRSDSAVEDVKQEMPSSFDNYFLSLHPCSHGRDQGSAANGGKSSSLGLCTSAGTIDRKGETMLVTDNSRGISCSGDGFKKQIWRACQRCRRLKQKCDSERPCGPCVRRGCAGSCVDWDRTRALARKIQSDNDEPASGSVVVSRPLAWRQAVAHVMPLSEATPPVNYNGEAGMSSKQFLQAAFRNLGVAHEVLQDIIKGIPEELSDALVGLVREVGRRTPFLQKVLSDGIRLNCSSQQQSGQLDSYPGCGYVRCEPKFEEGAGMSWQFQLNNDYCRLMSAHPEEVLARLQQYELEMPFSRVEQLCWLIDSIDVWRVDAFGHSALGHTITFDRYGVMARGCTGGKGEPLLCKVSCRISFDGSGHVAAIERWMQPLSVEEFDLHCRNQPALRRPFAHVLEDERSGAALLAEYSSDRAVSMEAMGQTADGERRLCKLAAHIRARAAELAALPPECEERSGEEGGGAGSPLSDDSTVRSAASPPAADDFDSGEGGGLQGVLWDGELLAELWNAADVGLLACGSEHRAAWLEGEQEAWGEGELGVWLEEL